MLLSLPRYSSQGSGTNYGVSTGLFSIDAETATRSNSATVRLIIKSLRLKPDLEDVGIGFLCA